MENSQTLRIPALQLNSHDPKWKVLGKARDNNSREPSPHSSWNKYSPRLNKNKQQLHLKTFKVKKGSKSNLQSPQKEHKPFYTDRKPPSQLPTTERQKPILPLTICSNCSQKIIQESKKDMNRVDYNSVAFREQISKIFIFSDKLLRDQQSKKSLFQILDTCKEAFLKVDLPKQLVTEFQEQFLHLKKAVSNQLNNIKLSFDKTFQVLQQRYELEIKCLKGQASTKDIKEFQRRQLLQKIPVLPFESQEQKETQKQNKLSFNPSKQIRKNRNAENKENRTSIVIPQSQAYCPEYILRECSNQVSLNNNVIGPQRQLLKNQLAHGSPRMSQRITRLKSFQKMFSTISNMKKNVLGQAQSDKPVYRKQISALQPPKLMEKYPPRPILKNKKARFEGQSASERYL